MKLPLLFLTMPIQRYLKEAKNAKALIPYYMLKNNIRGEADQELSGGDCLPGIYRMKILYLNY